MKIAPEVPVRSLLSQSVFIRESFFQKSSDRLDHKAIRLASSGLVPASVKLLFRQFGTRILEESQPWRKIIL